jgi:sugar lactone lactonase YvrE
MGISSNPITENRMKPKKKSLAAVLLCLAVFASASLAATSPLNNPRGLAVDAKGNLYVANTLGGANGTGNILVYSPSYVQLQKKTITQNINLPSAVAFDPSGNLWVANDGASNGGVNGSIAEYTAGVQNTSGVITNGIAEPIAIAIDGSDNIWVENNFGNITAYASTAVAFAPPITLVQTLTPPPPLGGLAIVGTDVLAFASNGNTYLTPTVPALVSGSFQNYYYQDAGGVLAGAAGNKLYFTDAYGTVWDTQPNGSAEYFTNTFYVPAGMATDSARGRVYISSGFGNSIYVYDMTNGLLLHVIQ